MKKASFFKGLPPRDGLDFHSRIQVSGDQMLEHFAPRQVAIPLSERVGEPAVPIVEVGSAVRIGQMIARPPSIYSSAVHASVSGVITDMRSIRLPDDTMCDAICIRNDRRKTMDMSVKKRPDPHLLTPKPLQALLARSGIVTMGDEGWPILVKCARAQRYGVHTLLVNGLQSEPHLTADSHLVREQTEKIIRGAVALAGCCKVHRIIFCTHDRWPQDYQMLSTTVERLKKQYLDRELSTMLFRARYPQGYERLIVRALYDINLRPEDRVEKSAGVVIFDVATCVAVSNQIEDNLPVVSRTMTLARDDHAQKNIVVPIGTLVADLLSTVTGVTASRTVVYGGALTGISLKTLDVPITKTVPGITLIRKVPLEVQPCTMCGACESACPMGLRPFLCEHLIERRLFDCLFEQDIDACIKCGACSYVCPSGRDLAFRIVSAGRRLKMEEDKREEVSAAAYTQ